ncbi:hypothetical protein CVT26_007542 [Gymnopilus dilepis]|uniref:Uncharacterized protein n=1 Tax=Gymnopilus dilepis TaxID=231916 RepID=A0A409WZ16_9AGAR|nr:hypothetical protein CVT26_007542 [Gymnopilus dilepis]
MCPKPPSRGRKLRRPPGFLHMQRLCCLSTILKPLLLDALYEGSFNDHWPPESPSLCFTVVHIVVFVCLTSLGHLRQTPLSFFLPGVLDPGSALTLLYDTATCLRLTMMDYTYLNFSLCLPHTTDQLCSLAGILELEDALDLRHFATVRRTIRAVDPSDIADIDNIVWTRGYVTSTSPINVAFACRLPATLTLPEDRPLRLSDQVNQWDNTG